MSSRIPLTIAELEAAVAHREKIIAQLIEAREASDAEWERRCADKDANIAQLIAELEKAEAQLATTVARRATPARTEAKP